MTSVAYCITYEIIHDEKSCLSHLPTIHKLCFQHQPTGQTMTLCHWLGSPVLLHSTPAMQHTITTFRQFQLPQIGTLVGTIVGTYTVTGINIFNILIYSYHMHYWACNVMTCPPTGSEVTTYGGTEMCILLLLLLLSIFYTYLENICIMLKMDAFPIPNNASTELNWQW